MIARQATRTVFVAVLTCLLVVLAAPAVASAANEFTVDNVLDGPDEELSDGLCKAAVAETFPGEGTCTLRAAIEEVNHREDTENTIKFAPAVFEGEESDAIFVSLGFGALPAIEFPTKIEGGSDCTADGVEGAPCAGVIGLTGEPVFAVKADDTTISGLAITAGSVGIGVYEESTGFEATGNWIGIGLNGSNALPASADGILLEAGSDEAVIGGSAAGDRNVIAFNDVGLEIRGASETTVRGNWFGVTGDGETPGPEKTNIEITNYTPVGPEVKAEDNEIGAVLDANAQASAECDGGCNVISSAEDDGIDLNGGSGPEEAPASGPTTIHGNYVGLLPAGTEAVDNGTYKGNKEIGIEVGGADEATVGGDPASGANFMVGGKLDVSAGGSSDPADDLVVEGNSIGRSLDGTSESSPPERGIFVNSEAIVASGDAAKLVENSITTEEEGTGIEQQGTGALIEGNDVLGGEVGIRTQGSNSDIGNTIKGNRVEASESSGILVQNGSNDVFGNEVREGGEVGILAKPAAASRVTRSKVRPGLASCSKATATWWLETRSSAPERRAFGSTARAPSSAPPKTRSAAACSLRPIPIRT